MLQRILFIAFVATAISGVTSRVSSDCQESCGGDPHAKSGCGVNCGRHCSDYYNKTSAPCLKICKVDGCDCKDGYYFDDNIQKCVLPRECSPVCGKNEEYSTCVEGGCFDARNCSEISNGQKPGYKCVKPIKCTKGCLCKKGYLRSSSGICVARKECAKSESCGGDLNAKSGCGVNCGRHCSDYYKKPLPCPRICKVDGCDCNDGYYFDDNTQKCVLPRECSPVCGSNEEYSTCVEGGCFDARNCSEISNGKKPGYKCVRPIKCTKGCLCKEGYLRSSSGICVARKECENGVSCGGDPNAQPGCGVNCGRLCSNYNTGPVSCIEICYEGGCDCKEGYVLDDNTKKCVLPQDCSETPSQSTNVKPSGSTGSNEGADQDDSSYNDNDASNNGSPGENNGATNSGASGNNTVSCGGDPNAQPGCGVNCGRLCSNYNTGPVYCPAICYEGGCDCKEGYVFDDNTKKCVLPQDCSETPSQSTNEIPSSSTGSNEGADQDNSSDNDNDASNNGSSGESNGETNSGSSGNNNVSCGGDPNAQPGCGVNCGRLCSNYNTGPVACPLICYVGGCDCKEGYVLDDNTKKCVLPQDCSSQSTKTPSGSTGSNEGADQDDSSDNTGSSGENEVSCGGDRNAEPGCGVNCGRLCSNYNYTGPVFCTEICYDGGCDCKEGYVLDDNTKTCVLPQDCSEISPACNENEEWNFCPITCPPNTCDSLVHTYKCPIQPAVCRPACTCKSGFYRNSIGDCIPKKDCLKCKGPNEEWNICPVTCPPNTCESLWSKYNCPIQPAVCRPGCTCKSGFFRNHNNVCISGASCSSQSTNVKPSRPTGSDVSANQNDSSSDRDGATNSGSSGNNNNGETIGNTPGDNNSETDALNTFSKAIDTFTIKFLQQVLQAEGGENVFVSPFSVMTPLLELALYAENNTLKELLSSLNLLSKDQIRQAFRKFLETTEGGEGVTFSKAVKVYVNDLYPISDSFRDDTQNVFNGTAENIDCSDPTGTANYINNWVGSETNNRITDLIPSTEINTLVRLILVSAIYFQAKWKEEFNKNNTKPADFYTSDKKTIQVSMMNIETELEYVESDVLKAQVVRIPYVNPDFNFVIVLPLDRDGFSDTVANLDADTMKTTLENLQATKVKLSLPSMELTTSLELVDILKSLGLNDIFDSGKADFQGILKSYEPLSVSAAIHKAFVKVNEEGSEAAAATGVVVSTRALPVPPPPEAISVVANHPFLFLILHNEHALFCGARLI